MMNVSHQQISYILALAELKNFGRAAEACFVTQPTLSMQIKKAEESLGYKIFDRSRNPLSLTEFGENLLSILIDMQEEYQKIERLAAGNIGKFKDEIKIGIIPTIASYLVPKLFENKEFFKNTYNWAIVELKSTEILEQIAAKKIDMGILAGPVLTENLLVESLFNEEILAYSPKVKKNSLSIEDFKDLQPWLLSNGNCLRTQMIHFCKLIEKSAHNWNYEGGNLEMLLKMVDNYGGYTLVPEFYAQKYLSKSTHIKTIEGQQKNQFPARNIISIRPIKQVKTESLNEIIKFIKLNFANEKNRNYEVLKWK